MNKILAVLPGGRIALASERGDIELWGAFSCERIGRLIGHKRSLDDEPVVMAIAALPDGRLASADREGPIRLWDIKKRRECGRLIGHTDTVSSLCVLPDGRLASGSFDETIRLWDVTTAKEVACFEEAHIAGIDKLIPLPGDRLASGDGEWNDFMLWDLKTETMIGDVETVEGLSVAAVSATPDGRLALGLFDGEIRILDPNEGALSDPLTGHEHPVTAVCELPDGRLASAAYDKTVRIWDLATHSEDACHVLDFVPADLAAHPDGRLIAANSQSRLVMLPL